MAPRTGERGRVVPVRDMERERASSGSGPVKEYMMSPEELEDYRARTGYKEPKNWDGEKLNQPVQHGSARPNTSSEEQSRRAKMRKSNGKEPDKRLFLNLIAAGKSIAKAERDMGLSVNGMYYWLKKWDLIGITPDRAKEMLESDKAVPPMPQVAPVDPAKVMKELRDRVADYENELARWAQSDNDKSLQIKELQEDRDNWKKVAEERKDALAGAAIIADQSGARINELERAVAELEDEREMLLETIESAAAAEPMYSPPHHLLRQDNVHSPAHYTAGGIETIDFIRAKLTPEEFLGYCKGNGLKYIARATHKGGEEDLRKAGVYLGWAVGGER